MADTYLSPYSLDECKSVIEQVILNPTPFNPLNLLVGGSWGKLYPFIHYREIKPNICEAILRFSTLNETQRQKYVASFGRYFIEEGVMAGVCLGKISLIPQERGTHFTIELLFRPVFNLKYIVAFGLLFLGLSFVIRGYLLFLALLLVSYVMHVFLAYGIFRIIRPHLKSRLRQIVVDCHAERYSKLISW
jgi:hypothetical protein